MPRERDREGVCERERGSEQRGACERGGIPRRRKEIIILAPLFEYVLSLWHTHTHACTHAYAIKTGARTQ